MLTVLDLAFAGSKDVGGGDWGGIGKDGGEGGEKAGEKDVSAALDRLDNVGGGSHLLGSLVSQLRGGGKAVRASPVSGSGHLHGRTFSVTSLISPHVTTKGGQEVGFHGASIGTDVVVDRGKKDALEIKCQQCGWHVTIQHCYSCGKKVTLSATPSAASAAVNGNGPSPPSASSLAAGSSSSSAAALPPTPHTPTSAQTLVCATCGVLFLSGQVKNCVQCGFDMMKTGQKIEPPLVKSLSWQRKQARGHSIEGYLMKVGKTLRNIVTRWYVIRDNFMYTYTKNGTPAHLRPPSPCRAGPSVDRRTLTILPLCVTRPRSMRNYAAHAQRNLSLRASSRLAVLMADRLCCCRRCLSRLT